MSDDLKPQEQLSEIHRLLADARTDLPGVVGFVSVWAALTLAVLLTTSVDAVTHRVGHTGLWAIHTMLGWSYTLLWSRRIARQTGRSFFRLRVLLRVWGMVTAAIWLTSFAVYAAQTHQVNPMPFLIAMFVGIGVFVTGILMESAFSQGLGVALGIVAGVLVIWLHNIAANRLIFLLVVVTLTACALGMWWTRRRH